LALVFADLLVAAYIDPFFAAGLGYYAALRVMFDRVFPKDNPLGLFP
jgi:hypothetical protein